MTGLKTHTTLTMAGLILSGMLLLLLVVGALWQRDLVRARKQQGEQILRMAEMVVGLADPKEDLLLFLSRQLRVDPDTCLALRPFGAPVQQGQADCWDAEMGRIQLEAETAEQTVMQSYGMTRGVVLPAKKYLVLPRPLLWNGNEYMLLVRLSLEPVYQGLRENHPLILTYGLVNLVILSAIGFFRFVRSTIRPLEQLADLSATYDGIHGVDFQMPDSGGEFRKLSSALQSMLRRIEMDRDRLRETVASLETANRQLQETGREMVRTEKLASVGRLAAGMAHEIGNPLGVVQGYLGLIRQADLSPEERRDFVGRAEQELQRITRLVRQLLDLSRSGGEQREDFSVHGVIEDLVTMFTCQPFMDGITCRVDLQAGSDIITAGRDQIRQVLLNGLLNAVDAIAAHPEGPRHIGIQTRQGDLRGKPSLIVQVSDTGIGIKPGDLPNIFDPFFTTKEPGKGTGLGLSVAYSIVQGYGGTLRVESKPGEGAVLIMELPLAGS